MGCWNQNQSLVSKGDRTLLATIDYDLGINRNVDAGCGSATSFRQLKFSGQFNVAGVESSVWHEPNQWYYVVFAYDGSYSKIYVNGVLEATSNYAPNLTSFTTYPLYINHHTWSYGYASSQRIQGIIDEVRISNVARSQQEISNYYNQAVPSLNQPPTISNLGQFKSDGLNQIIENTITTDSAVIFKAILNDPNNDQAKLQIELKEKEQNFNEQNLLESDFVNSGSEAIITKNGLIDGQYHWRVRAVDDKGNVSQWQEFGTAGNVDFEVKLPLSIKAAILAKELINQPYLLGGKGWGYNLSEFVAPNIIKSGYDYRTAKGTAFGAGVDCSGLIMWAYNRSFDPYKSRFNNFVKAENADGQYHDNTTSTTESELRQGDVMFFNNDVDPEIDHVAMYVGDSGGYDVVNAANTDLGIVGRLKDNLKQSSTGFVAFKRVVSALPPAVLVTAHSPVDLIVTDPDGSTITSTTTIPSDTEYLREIPGVLYYSEMERGADGNPVDQVYSYIAKTGDYIIQVLPEPGTSPTATYTLDFSAGNQSTILAQDVPISQIPSQGYGVTKLEIGTINSFIPVLIDIKPGSYPNSINLKPNGVTSLVIFGSATFDVKQIDFTTIKLANASVKLKGNGQPMVSYEDVNGDSFVDIVSHVITKDLQLTPSDTKANLEGKLIDGTVIKGSDSVRIVP